LSTLPDEVKRNNYLARYIESCLYIQTLQLSKAQDLLNEMELELTGQDGKKERAMLGEVYDRMAGVHMLQRKECFIRDYKKAYEYIPGGSAYKKRSMLRYNNYSIIFVQDYGPGALERMERAVHDGFLYMNAIENGAAAGFQYLFSAEAAFYRYDMKHAQEMAHKALFEAESADAHDIVCNAFLMLVRIELLRGRYSGVLGYIRRAEAYIDRIGNQELNEIKEFAYCWLDLIMGATDRVPQWFKTRVSNISLHVPLVIGRSELLYAIYLLQTKQYSEMVAFLEQIKTTYEIKGWGGSFIIYALLAIGHQKLGNDAQSADVFKELYDRTYHNHIITPFMEFANFSRNLIVHIRQSGKYDFDQQWLDDIYRKSSTFGKRISHMKKEHIKEAHLLPSADYRLSSREKEVLQCLAQGLTREELGEELHIGISTVKSVIRGIYNKLGAVNRADAVRIAVDSGIVT
jgi:LuxR family maltose regulon positive regulatory protein